MQREVSSRVNKIPSRNLVIPAAAAFGTGEHPTTAMCLRLLEQITRNRTPGWSFLDAGTGSGILALAAKCFGAGRVRAIDSDPRAISTAERNARTNRISTIHFRTTDVSRLGGGERFDFITANLHSELLIAALPLLRRRLQPTGHLILSGILREQESGVRRALRDRSFAIQKIRRRGKWIAIWASRPS